ncbi:AAA family ATPase [Acidobacteria bacterium AH-259-A15]|nr:AAA family ATPase [Acidobacteria bacterium AH-259-A15]
MATNDNSLIQLSTVEAEEVEWLWHPYIPLRKVTLIEGDPDLGKTWLTLAIAASVSRGKPLPKSEGNGEAANVLILSAEDGLADTIKPRLESLGADCSRIFAVTELLCLDDEGFDHLERYIQETKSIVGFIDPLFAYFTADTDIHRANETRSVMAKLAQIAEQHECALVCVRHLTKSSKSKSIYRGIGSIDLTAACRSVLMVGRDPDDQTRRAVAHIKSNLAESGPAIGYQIVDGNFEWTGVCELTAERMLAPDNGENISALDEAKDFIKDLLKDGPVLSNQVYEEAKRSGISKSTLNRAKKQLKIPRHKTGKSFEKAEWFWMLPEDNSLENVRER